jgi:hypothetical protein
MTKMDPDPNPDPLVRGMDPRIRIRIHPKMSWIRNTGEKGEGKECDERAFEEDGDVSGGGGD